MSSHTQGWNSHSWTVALVLAGFVMSLIGIRYGLPLHLLGDEESLIGGALTMLQLRTALPVLHPQAFALLYYPPVMPYIIIVFSAPLIALKWLAVGFSLAELQDYFALHQEGIWFAARAASAASAAGVLIITYLLAKQLYSRRVAYAALAFLSVSFMQVNLAHWMKHWSFSVLCAYLVFFFTVRYVHDGRGKRWAPGLAAGIAAGVSSITALGGVAAALYALWNRAKIADVRKFLLINAVLWFAVGGILTALHGAYFVKEYGGFFSLAASGMGKSFAVTSLLTTTALGFRALFYSDPVIFFGALAGLLLAYRYRLQNRMVLIGVFVYFIVLHLFFHFEPRYIYAVIPALAITAGSLIDVLHEKAGKIVALTTLVALLVYSVAVALRFDYLLIQPDTRNHAVAWILDNAIEDDVIISSPSITLFRDRDAMERELSLASLRAPERYLLEHYDELSSTIETARFTNLHFWKDRSDLSALTAYLDKYHPKYFIVELRDEPKLTGMEYSLIAGSTLVAEFSQGTASDVHDMTGNFFVASSIVFQLERLGPTVQIYRL